MSRKTGKQSRKHKKTPWKPKREPLQLERRERLLVLVGCALFLVGGLLAVLVKALALDESIAVASIPPLTVGLVAATVGITLAILRWWNIEERNR